MDKLRAAAARLELRPSQDGVPFERYSEELWGQIDARLPGYGPIWLRRVSIDFRLGGAGFRYPVDERAYMGNCVIPRPSSALWYVYQGWPIEDLFKFGFVCFAGGTDGDLWMFRGSSGVTDPDVLFLERSAWDGAEPSKKNGIIAPGIKLSQLISFAADWSSDDSAAT